MMRAVILLCVLGALCSCRAPRVVRVYCPPYERMQVAGTWFGLAEADLYLYRVNLELPDGGLGACSSLVSRSNVTFAVQGWSVNEINKLRIELSPGSEVATITGSLITDDMFVGQIEWAEGWTNSARFYKEAPVQERLRRLREDMEQAGSPAGERR